MNFCQNLLMKTLTNARSSWRESVVREREGEAEGGEREAEGGEREAEKNGQRYLQAVNGVHPSRTERRTHDEVCATPIVCHNYRYICKGKGRIIIQAR